MSNGGNDSALLDAIYEVMKEHGSDLLFPEDEFKCCAEAIAGLFEQVGWCWPPEEPWFVPYFFIVDDASDPPIRKGIRPMFAVRDSGRNKTGD